MKTDNNPNPPLWICLILSEILSVQGPKRVYLGYFFFWVILHVGRRTQCPPFFSLLQSVSAWGKDVPAVRAPPVPRLRLGLPRVRAGAGRVRAGVFPGSASPGPVLRLPRRGQGGRPLGRVGGGRGRGEQRRREEGVRRGLAAREWRRKKEQRWQRQQQQQKQQMKTTTAVAAASSNSNNPTRHMWAYVVCTLAHVGLSQNLQQTRHMSQHQQSARRLTPSGMALEGWIWQYLVLCTLVGLVRRLMKDTWVLHSWHNIALLVMIILEVTSLVGNKNGGRDGNATHHLLYCTTLTIGLFFFLFPDRLQQHQDADGHRHRLPRRPRAHQLRRQDRQGARGD